MKGKRKSNEPNNSDDDFQEIKTIKRAKKTDKNKNTSKRSIIAQPKKKITATQNNKLTKQNRVTDSIKTVSQEIHQGVSIEEGSADCKKNSLKLTGRLSRSRNGLIVPKETSSQKSPVTCSTTSDIIQPSLSQGDGYRSSQRQVCSGVSSSQGSQRSSRKRNTQKSSQYTPITKIPERPKHDGSCPFCQMPFLALTIESPRWHVTECMDLPLIAHQECPDGASCDSTLPSHFRRYRHTVLANVRAGLAAAEDKPGTIEQRHFSRKLNFDSSSKVTNKSPITKDNCVGDAVSQSNNNCSLRRDTAEVHTIREKTLTSTNTGCRDDCKIFPTKRMEILTVDTVKKSLFQTPEKEENEETSEIIRDKKESEETNHDNRIERNNTDDEVESDDDIFSEKKEASEVPGTNDTNRSIEDMLADAFEQEVDSSDSDCDGRDAGMNRDGSDDSFDIEALMETNTDTNNEDSQANVDIGACGDGRHEVNKDEYAENDDHIDDEILLLAAEGCDDLVKPEATIKETAKCTQDVKRYASRRSPQKKRPARNARTPSRAGRSTQGSSDNKQSSVLDYFRPMFGRAKQAVMSLAAGNPAVASTSKNNATTLKENKTADTGSVKPWPLRPQQTSKAGGQFNQRGSESGGGRWGAKKQCPFYKKMPGTPFTVDAFRYGSIPGCTAYFLSHFHYDHYGGLTKNFKHPMYCSKATANLVRKRIKVDDKYLKVLPMNQTVVVEGINVTLLEANHCPGSVLFLFQLPNGQTYLHTGDFRACAEMEKYPQLIGTKIHQLYLDTTYCDPAYAFPPQKEVIQFAVQLARETVYHQPNVLIVTGSYTIGKERIFLAIAEDLNSKICVTREKLGILECLEDPAINERLTLQKTQAKVHVLPMGWLNYEKLSDYLSSLKPRFDSVLAISPTGWTYSSKVTSLDKIRPKMKRDNITIYGLPYSEHSSFTELKRFVQFTKPEKVLATVNNGNPASRKKMDALFQSWLNETHDPSIKQSKQSMLTSWFK